MGDRTKRFLERLVASGQAGETTQARLVRHEMREDAEKQEQVELEALLGDKVAIKVLGEESPEISEDFKEWLADMEAICDDNIRRRLLVALTGLVIREELESQHFRREKEFFEKIEEFILSLNNEKLKTEANNLFSELYPENSDNVMMGSDIALSFLGEILNYPDDADLVGATQYAIRYMGNGLQLQNRQEEARALIQIELLPIVKGTGDPLAKRVQGRDKNKRIKESMDVIRDEEL